ncbi:MAG TPA: DegT/DnrJ/EryC1/StrS family aminotransferase [Candidatus Dormibacteraeota bacterium]|nr:DegT/DnrJ/EryC1/StrS family aminotransferase [Candidatus Dormibacteraeota bacterium]
MKAGARGVRFVDLQAQIAELQPEVSEAIASVVASAAFILGPDVARFEQEFAAYCDVPHAVGVDSGLSALELALRALQLRPGDEVITQANTYVATVSAIEQAGGRPVLVDCDEAGGIDTAALANAFTDRTRAVMPVHMYGRVCDIDDVVRIAKAHDVVVIEDACQAHGAVFDGRRAGTFGDAAGFSFYPGKNLGAFGDAGMMVTSSSEIADWVRKVRNYGQETKYVHELPPLNRRLDSIQAAVLSVKLRRLDDWNRRREWVADAYRERLAEAPVELPQEGAPGRHVYHLFPLQTDSRDALQEHLGEAGIETGIHYPIPVHRLPVYESLGYAEGAFPTAEAAARRMLSLPMYPELSIEAIDRVSEAVTDFFSG